MRVVLFGAPGSGKGTQARLIAGKFALTHICASELLRNAIAEGSEIGLQAKTSINQNQQVSDEIMLTLVQDRLSKPDIGKGFVLDGIPGNIAQSQALDNLLEIIGRSLDVAIMLDTEFDALMQRITGRLVCRSCGNVHNLYTDPPAMDGQCDECGGSLRHRADDNEEIITNRYRQYESVTMPVIEYYRGQDKIRVVQGIGDVDDIFAAVCNVLDAVEIDPNEAPMPTVEQLEELVLQKALGMQIEETQSVKKVAKKLDAEGASVSATKKSGKKKPVKKQAKKSAVKEAVTPKKKVTSKKSPAKKKVPAKKAVAGKAASKKKPASKKKVTVKKKVAKKTPVKKKAEPKKRKAVVKKKTAAPKKKVAKKKVVKKKK